METMGVTQKKKLPTQPVLFTVVQHWRDLRKFRKTFGKGEGGVGALSTGNTLVSLNHTISPTLHIRKKGRNTFLSWIDVPLCYRKWCCYLFLFLGFVLFCFCFFVCLFFSMVWFYCVVWNFTVHFFHGKEHSLTGRWFYMGQRKVHWTTTLTYPQQSVHKRQSLQVRLSCFSYCISHFVFL